MCYSITMYDVRSNDQYTILVFVFALTNYCFYLNNVKAFYLSMFTSHLFRKTFINGFTNLLPRQIRPRFQVVKANISMATVTRMRRGDTSRRQ
jgi:hypothetical protein